MKYYPDIHADKQLKPGLRSILAQLRADDAFDVAKWANEKALRLNEYFRRSRLKTAVVAVSGGVDSALVLGLCVLASRQADSPIEQVIPVLLPVHDDEAATNQDVATSRGRELCAVYGLSPVVIDLTPAHSVVAGLVESSLGVKGQGWAKGQLVAYQRTPALYYVTSLCSEMGKPGVIVGTTNYDEGAYLGYFGKASDGLVDLQLISDAHKSEVYATAAYLGAPDSILAAIPTGDMYDGRVDEEVFGASYDFVELFLRAKREPEKVGRMLALTDEDSLFQFRMLSEAIEQLHGYNRHKYIGRSPAVHLDILERHFKGSWNYSTWSPA